MLPKTFRINVPTVSTDYILTGPPRGFVGPAPPGAKYQFCKLDKIVQGVLAHVTKTALVICCPAKQPGHCLRQWNVSECPQRLADTSVSQKPCNLTRTHTSYVNAAFWGNSENSTSDEITEIVTRSYLSIFLKISNNKAVLISWIFPIPNVYEIVFINLQFPTYFIPKTDSWLRL